MASNVIIMVRRDVTANWKSKNPTLKLGEIAADMTLHKLKVGDNVNSWNNLPWINGDLEDSLEKVVRLLSGITGGSMLEPVDNISNLSSTYPSPTTGDICYVRNADAFYYWTGTNWTVVTASGTDTSAVNSLIDAKLDAFGTFGMSYTVNALNDASRPTKITFEDGVVAALEWRDDNILRKIIGYKDAAAFSSGIKKEEITFNYNDIGTLIGRTVTRY
ncbi:MAG: hypothetical protein IJP88_07410 [Synergistaceae bacterium]|nr:hypothetical protein [Synergistaceae bacterium]MBQ6909551.1 hypothetical protein [Synergistaceae bacterium]MBR0096992.1 hypothetical protein [Synergistaceae bacterium]